MKRKSTLTQVPTSLCAKEILSKPMELMGRLIQKEVSACAQLIGTQADELQAWIDLQIEVPAKRILALLRTSKQYQLDPLQEEVLLTQYDDSWQASISVDAWIKLINRQPAFEGITFCESPETDQGLPIWMECTIYRSDRAIPITIREYLSEVKNESEIWKKMPRRMLRHRALQQCARLAIGIEVKSGGEKDSVNLHHKNKSLTRIAASPVNSNNYESQSACLKGILRQNITMES